MVMLPMTGLGSRIKKLGATAGSAHLGKRHICLQELRPICRVLEFQIVHQSDHLLHRVYNKKAVLSGRWPRDTPTKVNKQPHLHLRSRDSRLTQFNRTLWT